MNKSVLFLLCIGCGASQYTTTTMPHMPESPVALERPGIEVRVRFDSARRIYVREDTVDRINFVVSHDVYTSDGRLLVREGSHVKVEVRVRGPRGVGRAGSYIVSGVGVRTVYGATLRLSGSFETVGRSRVGSTVAMALLVPPFLVWLGRVGKYGVLEARQEVTFYSE